jgi:SOS-response transcriptional repressor LexA
MKYLKIPKNDFYLMKILFFRQVKGKSMLPALIPNKVILASCLKRYKKGSLVIALVNGREIIKRVKKISQDFVWLTSDNPADGWDSRHFGPVKREQILGTKL